MSLRIVASSSRSGPGLPRSTRRRIAIRNSRPASTDSDKTSTDPGSARTSAFSRFLRRSFTS
jgi:hypothetical protein